MVKGNHYLYLEWCDANTPIRCSYWRVSLVALSDVNHRDDLRLVICSELNLPHGVVVKSKWGKGEPCMLIMISVDVRCDKNRIQ